MTLVVGESRLDYKYRRILETEDVDYRVMTWPTFLRTVLIRQEQVDYYHIRYLKWKGYLPTFPFYLAVLLLCLIARAPIIWTCHNLCEHKFPSRLYNWLLVQLLSAVAWKIVVLHEEIGRRLPCKADKIVVTSFGNYKGFFESWSPSSRESAVCRNLDRWVSQRGGDAGRIVFVGEYHENKNLEWPLALIEAGTLNGGIIAPGLGWDLVMEGAFIYGGRDPIVACVPKLLSGEEPVVGYLAHENMSVPTALYVYASYGVPVVSYDVCPLSEIVEQYECGVLFGDPDGITEGVRRVYSEYEKYSDNIRLFLEDNSWKRARAVHMQLLTS